MQSALDSATLVFWEKGYRGTSLDDLTEAMQINRPSLYSAFGDKEKLFLSVVDHYRSTYIAPPVQALLKSPGLKTGLQEFFQSMAQVVCSKDKFPPGCLVACLLSEDCCDSEVIKNKLSEVIHSADSAFTKVFSKFQDELKAPLSPEGAAKLMTTTLHGMSIRARSGAPERDLQQIAEAFIACVCS